LNERDVLPAFTTAAFPGEAEERDFVESARALKPPDALKLLEVVSNRALAQKDPGRHTKRLKLFAAVSEGWSDKALFLPFVRALRTADAPLRNVLVEAIPKVNSVEAHGELAGLLRAPEPLVRGAAARALSRIGGRTVFEMVGKLVPEPPFPGRIEAMDVLVALAPQHTLAHLKTVLAVGSVAEKQRAIQHVASPACSEKDPAAAAVALAPFLSDPAEPLAVAAATGFCALAGEDEFFEKATPILDEDRLELARVVLKGLSRFKSPRATRLLSRKLREGPNSLRQGVLEVLEVQRDETGVPLLVEALELKNPLLRSAAANLLSQLGQEGRVDLSRTVLWLLKSRDQDVRRFGVELARSAANPESLWPQLVEYLRDEDWWVRERVGDVLVEIAADSILRPVAQLLSERDPLIRRFGADMLRRLKNPAALGTLVRAADTDADWWVREGAVEALGAIGDARVVPHLVDMMTRMPEVQVACLRSLGDLKALSVSPHVAALLASSDPDVRGAAIDCLSRCEAALEAPSVQGVLEDTHPANRIKAREFLLRFGSESRAGVRTATGSFLDQLLVRTVEMEADDLVLLSDRRASIKRSGRMEEIPGDVLPGEQLRALILPRLSVQQREDLAALHDVDFSYEVPGRELRFRAHVFNEMGGIAAVFRTIKNTLLDIDKAGFPEIVKSFQNFKDGLVLIGGPTGAGKSTTLAALIDAINRTSSHHILSIEDPVEVVHHNKKSLVNQREIGGHVPSFSTALRAALRQDPDVLLIGEVRDFETITAAVSAAETGHLVFGSVHTTSAASTVDRLVSAAPSAQQDHMRSLLAGSLRAVVCQFLLRRLSGGRCLAVEVMINNEAVASLIRKGKGFQIPSVIATAREQGMQLMDAELMRLFKEGQVSAEEVFMKSANKKDFENLDGAPAAAPAPTPSAPPRPGAVLQAAPPRGGPTRPGA
jgi:twitching motility protein PilT